MSARTSKSVSFHISAGRPHGSSSANLSAGWLTPEFASVWFSNTVI